MPKRKSTHVDDPAAVGRRLREARERAGVSQRRLAFPGCTPAYISRIEAGDRIPSLQLLRELGRRLGVSEDYLATGSERAAASARLIDAEVALRLDQTDEAERLYRAALEHARSPSELAEALAGLGQVAFRRGDPQAAIERLEQALELRGGDSAAEVGLADTLGRAYAMVGEIESAISLLERTLAAVERRGDKVETLRFTVLLAYALMDSGDFRRAETLVARALSIGEEIRDPVVRARLHWSQSRLHGEQGEMELAARHARRALEILLQTEHTHYTARAHQLLASIELDRGRADEALELLRSGWPLLAETGSPVERAQFRLEEARSLAALGRGEEAAAIATEIAPVLLEADPGDAGRSYSVLAGVFESTGDRARAGELYELAVELLEGYGPNRYVVAAYSRWAELLEAEGRKDEAYALMKKALQVQTALAGRERR